MKPEKISFTCAVPPANAGKITIAHGSGGRLTNDLIKNLLFKEFNNEYLEKLHDGAVVKIGDVKIAFTTDSFVVKPLFFPGGNIGDLAVNGTVNDLSMCGAKPLYLSCSLIIEEGFDTEKLEMIIASMKKAAAESSVQIVTGDTKVVEKGKGDKIFINTAGIGIIDADTDISPERASPGDKIILSGSIGDHGMAVLIAREELPVKSSIKSDTAALNGLVECMLGCSKNIHVLRDPTRGGLAASLIEIASSAGVTILINEDKIKISEEVSSACELLGFDPLHIANEGKLICILPSSDAGKVLDEMKKHPLGKDSMIIGEVKGTSEGKVILQTIAGTHRKIDLLSADQLPRIC